MKIQEFDFLRVMIYIFSMTISIVTIIKQLKLKGIIGTSTKIISLGLFFSVSSLLFQTVIIMIGEQIQDPIWEPVIDIALSMVLVLGIGLIFFGLWKISLFFDEIHNQAQEHIFSIRQNKNE
ncbi:MAG: hypothetical protein JSU57_00165 [Candidatus Heimdallarchaeota archaeon]|nr:MAG: hypothetical protein JSU57_00165 [Candidatus Heimdallarchaeota archaeon]